MSSKRPYDGEEPIQLPYKYSRQFASDEKMISFVDENLASKACMLPGIETNGKLYKPHLLFDPFEVKCINKIYNVADEPLVDSLRFPLITDSHGDDKPQCRDFHRSFLPEYFLDSGSPRRAPGKVDALSCFLDRYPRKPVPIGANHQADLPARKISKPSSSGALNSESDQVLITDQERILMGTCVIPMPDSALTAHSLPDVVGPKDCDCLDKASFRCVRQHVKEARDKLLKALGEDTFRELGLLDTGEEVSNKWSEEEEQVFHAIVFSNPASVGKDFWSCLSEEFPARSIKDIVSYYFNVFMLRKRAAQNRSRFLDIDSDDDEWHPGHGYSYDPDFAAEDGDDNYFSGEGDASSVDDDKKDSSQLHNKFSHEDNDHVSVHQDGSHSLLKYQSRVGNSPTKTSVSTKDNNRAKNGYRYVSTDHTEFDNGLNQGCLVDSNFRQWDQGFSTGLDHLLPTQNMIEEIFGPGSWDNNPNQD